MGASVGRLRQTRTMDEARALVPLAMVLTSRSVCIGQVPVIENPAWIIAVNMVSQPLEEVCSSVVSLCL